MTSTSYPPLPDSFKSWQEWAKRFIAWSGTTDIKDANQPRPILLAHLIGSGNVGMERPGTPGILMYDPVAAAPVYSDGTVWVPIAAAGSVPVLQTGVVTVPPTGTIAHVFSTPFAAAPRVLLTPLLGADDETAVVAFASAVSTTGVTIEARLIDNAYSIPVKAVETDVMWLAVLG